MAIRRSPSLRTVAVALLLVSALAGCKAGKEGGADKDGKDGKPQVEAVPVEVAQVSRRPIAASYAGTATLEPLAESQVVAKTSGVALEVLVEEGQQVKAGQPLVRLDADRARLSVAQAQAQLRKLENNYSRAQQLVAQQLISAGEVDQMRYDLENARAQHEMAKLELSYTTVVAPISGVVASRDIKPGNFVQINSPIFRIVDSQRLEATLNVPEREIAKLRPGQQVRLVADALVVPRTALLEDGGEPAVYVVREGKAVRSALKLGYDEAGWVEVREGLQAGDAVVVAGKAALREGSAVQVLGQGKDKAQAGPAATQAATR